MQHSVALKKNKAKLQFLVRNGLPIVNFLENGHIPIYFLSSAKWSIHPRRTNEVWKTKRFQKHFLSRCFIPCTQVPVFCEVKFILTHQEHIKKASSDMKSHPEMHTCGGLTPKFEWGIAVIWGMPKEGKTLLSRP